MAISYEISSMQTNDGSKIVLMVDGDERTPIAHVLLQSKAKRGEAWRAECPKRDAIADRIVSILNGGT